MGDTPVTERQRKRRTAMPLASHSTATIAQVLSGIDFPANKQQLVDYAQKNNADKEVIEAIQQMPEAEYTSMADVFKGVGQSH
jgi:hypothetical protein